MHRASAGSAACTHTRVRLNASTLSRTNTHNISHATPRAHRTQVCRASYLDAAHAPDVCESGWGHTHVCKHASSYASMHTHRCTHTRANARTCIFMCKCACQWTYTRTQTHITSVIECACQSSHNLIWRFTPIKNTHTGAEAGHRRVSGELDG